MLTLRGRRTRERGDEERVKGQLQSPFESYFKD